MDGSGQNRVSQKTADWPVAREERGQGSGLELAYIVTGTSLIACKSPLW